MTTITTRSGKGSPLTNDEVDANFTGLNSDKVETSGDSMTGDLSFGDNNKATFGAGSDLQIYHSGSHSIIDEAGTGDLYLRSTNGDAVLIYAGGTTSSKKRISANSTGEVELYYGSTARLATTSTGIDVTGSVTADGGTFDGNVLMNSSNELHFFNTNYGIRASTGLEIKTGDFTRFLEGSTEHMRIASGGDISFYNSAGNSQSFFWDASESRLGLGTTDPISDLEIEGVDRTLRLTDTGSNSSLIKLETDNFSPEILVQRQGVNPSYVKLVAFGQQARVEMNNLAGKISNIISDSGGSMEFETDSVRRMNILSSGDILSYADDGTTEGMRWDASTSRLGIGTPSPDYALNLEGSEATILIHNTTGSPDQALMILQADMGTNNRNFQIKSPATDSSADPFRFVTGNSFAFEIDSNDSAFVIDSNANIGIGTASPSSLLDVANGTAYSTSGDFLAAIQQNTNATGKNGLSVMNAWAATTSKIFEAAMGWNGASQGYYPVFTIDGLGQVICQDENGSGRLKLDVSGNFGVGIPDPDARLDIGTTNAIIDLKLTNTQAETAGSADYNVNIKTQYAEEQFTIHTSDTYRGKAWIGFDRFGQEITFGTGASGTQKMVIAENGDVGIGTTAPQTTLQVTQSADNSSDGIRLTRANEAASFTQWVDTSAQYNIGYSNPSTADPSSSALTITSAGDVGIGTSPDQRLHIYDSNCIFKMEHFANNTSRIYFSSTTDGDWGAINATNTSGARTITITPNSATGDSRYGGLVLGQNEATIGGVFDTDYGLNVYGDVGVGTTDITDSYKMIIEGSDQETANLTDTGTHGATLFLRALGENVGSGGAVAFGTTNGNKRPFAAIKGYVLDGTANSVGDLVFSTRATTSATALTERMTLTNSGRLVIGVNSAQGKLDVQSDGQYTPAAYFRNDGNATGWARADWYNDQASGSGIVYRDQAGSFVFRNDNSSGTAMTTRIVAGGTTAGNIVFNKDASSGGEVARFDTSGNFLVGTTSTNPHTTSNGAEGGARFSQGGLLGIGRNANPALHVNRITDDGLLAMWYRNGANVGNISVTSTATTYNTSSDQRLKENIVDAPSASNDIDAIQVRSFDWKADGSHQKYGMIAQELQTVAPEAVSEGDTEEDMMGVDYSKLVPMLVKEIQSLRARVAQLEND